jgi:hypothetical protein
LPPFLSDMASSLIDAVFCLAARHLLTISRRRRRSGEGNGG